MYYFYGGDFEGSLTPTVNQPSDVWNGFKFFLRSGPNWPDTVYFTGPDGSGYNSTPSATREVYEDHTAYYSQYNDSLNYPPTGQYTIDYTLDSGPGTLKFSIPDQSRASENTILPIPTVALNSDGTINKVTWIYRAAKENASEVRPESLIEKIELQIAGNGVQCEDPRQENRMYNSGNLSADTKEHVLRCQNLLWSTVTNITLAYDDVYGNHNVVTWVHQSAR
ncbi:MAG: hypothetical protein K9K82_05760 [Desulfobacteraceae bacterium]|nr:hypothetical protein [Desulfobacteraceae bacterium]